MESACPPGGHGWLLPRPFGRADPSPRACACTMAPSSLSVDHFQGRLGQFALPTWPRTPRRLAATTLAGPHGAARGGPKARLGGCEPPAPLRLGGRTVRNRTSETLCRVQARRGGAAFAGTTWVAGLPSPAPAAPTPPFGGWELLHARVDPGHAGLGHATRSNPGLLTSARYRPFGRAGSRSFPLQCPCASPNTLVAAQTAQAAVFRRELSAFRYSLESARHLTAPDGPAKRCVSPTCATIDLPHEHPIRIARFPTLAGASRA